VAGIAKRRVRGATGWRHRWLGLQRRQNRQHLGNRVDRRGRTVDIGSNHYALWGASSIPAGATLILAQLGFETFDGSDLNPAGCFGCDPSLCMTAVSSTIPVVHVAVGGTTMTFIDSTQVLNTHGVDRSSCPDTGTRNDESEPWR
jgi:hypothetical protein